MADNAKLILFGAAGVAIWWFYFRTPATAPPATTTTGTTTTGTSTATTTPPAPSVLDAAYKGMVAAAKAPAAGLGVDDWGFFLNQQIAPKVSPDPMPLFTAAIPNFDRSQLVPVAQYWAVMAPALKSQLGLSGLGNYGMAAAMSTYGSNWGWS